MSSPLSKAGRIIPRVRSKLGATQLLSELLYSAEARHRSPLSVMTVWILQEWAGTIKGNWVE